MYENIDIAALIKALNFNAYNFEKEIGCGQGTISKAIREERPLTEEINRKILTRFPTVSREWLMFGTGNMFVHGKKTSQNDNNNTDNELNLPNDNYSPLNEKSMIDKLIEANASLVESNKTLAQTNQILASEMIAMRREVSGILERHNTPTPKSRAS